MQLVYDEIYGDHLRGIPHPESPERVEAVAGALRRKGLLVDALRPDSATDEEIERVHKVGYVRLVCDEVSAMRGRAGYLSTGDTVVDDTSLDVARRAAGGAIAAARIACERGSAAFALVRPPGHHAESGRGMGFCVFNNAAIAARAVQAQFGFRALIVDFDYHHGNGTQSVAGGGLSYVSTHAFPAYPGTGGADENYALAGRDAIVNVPLPPHAFGTEPFVALWQTLLRKAVHRVRPDVLIVSAGFDYAAGDPVGDLGVDVSAAYHLASTIRAVAQEYCGGRAAYVLEGGYDLSALARSVELVVRAHREDPREPDEGDARAIPAAQRATLSRIDGIV